VCLVFRRRHLVAIAAPYRPSVGAKRNTSKNMIRVQLMHLAFWFEAKPRAGAER